MDSSGNLYATKLARDAMDEQLRDIFREVTPERLAKIKADAGFDLTDEEATKLAQMNRHDRLAALAEMRKAR